MTPADRLQKFFLLLFALTSIAAFTPPAAAKKAVAPPEIERFTVTP